MENYYRKAGRDAGNVRKVTPIETPVSRSFKKSGRPDDGIKRHQQEEIV